MSKSNQQNHQFPAPPIAYVGSRQPKETELSLLQITDHGMQQQNIGQLSELITLITEPGKVNWISVVGLKNSNLINELCSQFNIHPLIIEDVLHTEQSTKIDIFDDYLYIVIRIPRSTLHPMNGESQFDQVSFIIMKNCLVTFQEGTNELFTNIQKQFINYLPKTRELTIGYIVYSLLDAVISSYFALSDRENELIEEFEDKLIQKPDSLSLTELYKIKRNITNLKRVVLPLRDVISTLTRQGSDFLHTMTHVYFRDLYEHCLRLSEQLDSYRDILTSMLEIYRSSVNNKMNEAMRMLTLIATIFIPITFFASLFSMNFKYQPPLEWHYGFYTVIGIIVSTVTGMSIYFRKRKWM